MPDTAEMTLKQLEGQSRMLGQQIVQHQEKLNQMHADLKAIRSEIQKRNKIPARPRVSDHAIVRYLERVMDLDIEELRASILTPAVIDAINAGATAVKYQGHSFVVQDKCLVTVLDKNMRPKNRTKRGMVDVDELEEGLQEAVESGVIANA